MIRGTHLAGRLCKHVETIEVGAVTERAVTLLSSRRIGILVCFTFGEVGKFVEAQEHALTVTEWNRLAFLDQVIGETVDTTLGKLFATGLASVLVSVARVL
jgi:hypothetical protein